MSYVNMSHKNYNIGGDHPYNDALVLLTDASSKYARVNGKPQEPDPRAVVLLEAARCILKDRNSLYGEPEDNFAIIAPYSTAVLQGKLKEGQEVDGVDVALLTAGVKLGRLHTGKQVRDTWVDLIGYIACAFRCSELSRAKEAEKEPVYPKDIPASAHTAKPSWYRSPEFGVQLGPFSSKEAADRAEKRYWQDKVKKEPTYPWPNQSIFERQY